MKLRNSIITKPINTLIPYARNNKKHPEHQINLLAGVIKEFGFNVPVLIDTSDNIIAGHGRILAAKRLNLEEVPCIIVDDLNKAQIKALRLADNRMAELAETDEEMLKLEIQELQVLGQDVADLGYNIDDMPFMNTSPDDVQDVEADNPEEIQTDIVTGDLFQLGNHRLLCGDSCSEADVSRLMDGQKADMCFTDPPYGIDYSGGRTQVVSKKAYGKIIGDSEKNIEHFLNAIKINQPKIGHTYICLSPINLKPFYNVFSTNDGIIIWKKNNPGLGYQWIRRYCEFIMFLSTKKKKKDDASEFDFWEIKTDNKQSYEHGTQKPIELASRAIRYSSSPNQLVIDLFGGSGSTLIAAEQLNRKCFMIEIDPKYCQVIINRWEKLTGQTAVKL